MSVKIIGRILGTAALALALAAMPAQASTMTVQLSTSFNGTAPTSTPPWLTAVFTDISGGVQLDLMSGLEVPSEFISEVTFNVTESLWTSLNWVRVSGPPVPVISWSSNLMNLTGGGAAGFGFDIRVNFETAANLDRFDGADVVRLNILSNLPMTVSDFNLTNTGSAQAIMGAHIQGIPAGTTSGAIKNTVPDGGMTLTLLGGVLMGLGGLRRLFRR
jgi:hypothetical protein